MSKSWQNWSGAVQFSPSAILNPSTQEELIAIVKDCRSKNRKLRVIGSGHSFVPLVQTDGVLVSLDNYAGIEAVDREKAQVTVKAGTKIKALGEELFKLGLAQPNLGDIDVQSIAGAISTGTHGSGLSLGSISTQVAGLTLVTAEGELVECSEEHNQEIFKAAQVSLGALGIISKVKLQLVPAFKLDYIWSRQSLDYCLENLEKYKQQNRNFEFFWIPYTKATLVKTMNPTDKEPQEKNLFRRFNEIVLENGVLWLLSEFSRFFPARAPGVARLIGGLISGGHDINYSHKIFATPRFVKFQEMEYNLPVEHFSAALCEIDECIRREKFEVHFPVECRFVKGDDIFLSPANGRDSAYIAVHMYKGMAYKPYFEAMEAIFKKYGGRPHWGKMHTRTAAELKELYPLWDRFQAVRQQLDPQGFFLNDHLRTVFEETVKV